MTAIEDSHLEKATLFHSRTTMLQLKETIQKTKSFFHKSLQNFKSFFSGGYQKLPKSLSFNPSFLCKIGSARTCTSDQLYNEFYDLMQCDLSRKNMFDNNNNNISKSKDPALEDAACNGSFMCFAKKSPQKSTYHEVTEKEKKNKGSSQLRKKEDLDSQNMNKGAHVLAQKMKELNMMNDAGDLEHVLDIEEALHYYSRLKSPVYLDIVDKFFMDINSEFFVPQPFVSFKCSKERLGSIQLHKR